MLCLNIAFSQSPMQAAGTPTITAVTSGNWSSNSTWGGTLPVDDDRVLIPGGFCFIVIALLPLKGSMV